MTVSELITELLTYNQEAEVVMRFDSYAVRSCIQVNDKGTVVELEELGM